MTKTTRVQLAGRQTRFDAGQQAQAIEGLAHPACQHQYADTVKLPSLAPQKAGQS
jgi:hypothetical protein